MLCSAGAGAELVLYGALLLLLGVVVRYRLVQCWCLVVRCAVAAVR